MTAQDHNGAGWKPSAGLFWGLFAVCVLLAVGGFVFQPEHHFWWQAIPAFYPLFGFLAFVLIVQISKFLKKLWMRREDYYDG